MTAIVSLLVRVLEVGFAIGVIGSFLVLLLTTIEDVEELFGAEKKKDD